MENDPRIMNQISKAFLSKGLNEYTGDYANVPHFLWGKKPAIYSSGKAIEECLDKLENNGLLDDNFLSLKLSGGSKIYINRRNFRDLVKSDPEYFGQKFSLELTSPNYMHRLSGDPVPDVSAEQKDPDFILKSLKANEPRKLTEEAMGAILGYGKHNGAMSWRRGLVQLQEGMEAGDEIMKAREELPWESSRNQSEFKLFKPPTYNNWPCSESSELIESYRKENAHITDEQQFSLWPG